MIAFLRGKIALLEEGAVVLDVGGVGYRVLVPVSFLTRLPGPGQEVQMPTHLVVREDSLQLYGFSDYVELELFTLLLNVSGVGPKGALAVLSALSPPLLFQAVTKEDVKTITKVPGIGKKTAQRIILELKDKLKGRVAEEQESEQIKVLDKAGQTEIEDAVSALTTLGYSGGEARAAVLSVIKAKGEGISTSELLKLSLRKLDAQN